MESTPPGGPESGKKYEIPKNDVLQTAVSVMVPIIYAPVDGYKIVQPEVH